VADKAKTLEDVIKDMPPDLYQTALDYLRLLTEKRDGTTRGVPQVDWQHAVADVRDGKAPDNQDAALTEEE
jgi:hypothetical protein